jgi:predicted phosphate transport protein (TIGR00153 family)
MKINSLLSVFAPKDVKFLPMLNEAGSVLVHSAELLKQLFESQSELERTELCKLIKAEELKGDKVTGRVFKALNETFITPFDREDIYELTEEIDDSIDAINRAAHKVLLYDPHHLPKCTADLSEIVRKASMEVQSAVDELSNLKKTDVQFREHCREIKRLEEKADVVYEEGIIALFKEEKDTVELIKLKEIIQELEKSANKINNIGKVLKSILVKYA